MFMTKMLLVMVCLPGRPKAYSARSSYVRRPVSWLQGNKTTKLTPLDKTFTKGMARVWRWQSIIDDAEVRNNQNMS